MNTRDRYIRNLKIVDAYNEGTPAEAIAERFSVTAATVYHVLREAKEEGIALSPRRSGRRPGNTERNTQIADAYRSGRTLESIGAEYGLSRERVRQIVKKSGIETYGRSVTAYRRWSEEHGPEVNDTFSRIRSINGTIAAHPDVPHAWIKRLLRPRAHESVAGRQPTAKIWADADIFRALRAASTEGVVTTTSYAQWRNQGNTIDDRIPPTATLITWRFGSWRSAVEQAGLTTGRTSRSEYTRRWTRDDALAAVRRFADEASARNLRPTYARYDAWVSENPNNPSGAYLRHLTGCNWSEILMEAINVRAVA